MKKKKIENNLASAVSRLVPQDGFEKISAKIHFSQQKERIIMSKNVKPNFGFKKIAAVAVAACLVLSLGIFGFNYYGNNLAVATVVDIDVNPSIEISANKQDRVIEVTAVNKDAEKVLDGMNLEKTDINVAVNAIIGSMLKNGYLKGENPDILVTVQNDDKAKANNLRKNIVLEIDESLADKNVKASVVNQTVTNSSSAKDFADKHNISVGKATFVLKLAEKDASIKAEELADMSIKDIVLLARQKGIDADDVMDLDYDDDNDLDDIFDNDKDDIREDVEDIQEEINEIDQNSNPQASQPQADVKISKEKAKEIALNRAGLKAADVKFIKAQLDRDDGIYKYEIEFVAGNYEYDFEINAQSGKILDYDKELRDRDDDDDDYKGGVVSSKPASKFVSKDAAKTAALKKAGVSADKAIFEEVELDKDDSVYKYEISFRSGKYEYDCEVDAVSGKVIRFEKEIDD